ncbi:hypothetical protein [Salinisphaera sp. T5B8]|uniref:post-PEP-CTERM-1 domain-containing protein n=1 Tax=Salinisphaera sp. T5B8 TaxID=1304154 RepID=UPI00333E97CE
MNKPMRFSKITALALTLAASVAATGAVFAAEQKIFIDPETGEIVAPPAEKAEGTNPGEAGQKASIAAPKAWKNSEGAQMLTPSFESAPMTRAVRCPDGSLHMGHVDHDEASDDTGALCAAHNR